MFFLYEMSWDVFSSYVDFHVLSHYFKVGKTWFMRLECIFLAKCLGCMVILRTLCLSCCDF